MQTEFIKALALFFNFVFTVLCCKIFFILECAFILFLIMFML